MVRNGNNAQALHTPSLAGTLPDGWSWCRLDDACEAIFDCPHSTPTLTMGGPYVVRTQDVMTGTFRTDQAAHVSEETYQDRIRRAEPRFGDLLFSREGTYFGIAAEVPKRTRVCLGQRMVLLRPRADRFRPRFLKYWLNSPILATHVAGHRDGTVAERLNMPTIRALPVPTAPFAEQERIADILGTLDDKIELNRRMNETLEGICRAIFKSWFIDFDPVHAKAAARRQHPKLNSAELSRRALPHLDPKIAELFPDSFTDSELGLVPTSWKAGSVGDLVSIAKESVTPARHPAEIFDHYSIPAFDDGRWPRAELGADIKSNKFVVPESSVLISKLNPRIPRSWLAPSASSRRCICSTEFLVTLPHRTANSEYVYCLFGSPGFREEFAGRVTGTSGSHQRVKPADLLAVGCVVPDASCIAGFQEAVAALLSAQQHNLAVNRQLTTVRDSLLPNLFSGRLSSLHGGRL